MKNQKNDLINQKKEQFFLFKSNKDIYAFEALEVLEIVEYQHITKVPMMSNYIKGSTNIRGNIIAVIDLLQRFGLQETQISKKTSFAILKKDYLDKELQIAVIIEEVYEVENISIQDVESTPNFGTNVDKIFIKNMAKYKNEYIPILDIDTVLDIDELSTLSSGKGKIC